MFNKQFYGRIFQDELKKEGCYGNWEFNLIWEDQLRGKIKYGYEEECIKFGP